MAGIYGDSLERKIKNEEDFRQFNIAVREAVEPFMDKDNQQTYPLGLVCECSNPDCVERIELTIAQRRKVRKNPLHFIIVPGHEDSQVETVVEKHQNYYIVEKLKANQ